MTRLPIATRRAVLASSAAMALGMVAPLAPAQGHAQTKRRATGYVRTNWSRDPHAFGSYSFVAQGAKRRQIRDLAAPVHGRLFFAGEATHPHYNSTAHAAYESGQIAAEAVQDSAGKRVCILGAGISGLAAAQALQTSG